MWAAMESVSNDYGSGSVLKISDAELTSLDLEIIRTKYEFESL